MDGVKLTTVRKPWSIVRVMVAFPYKDVNEALRRVGVLSNKKLFRPLKITSSGVEAMNLIMGCASSMHARHTSMVALVALLILPLICKSFERNTTHPSPPQEKDVGSSNRDFRDVQFARTYRHFSRGHQGRQG